MFRRGSREANIDSRSTPGRPRSSPRRPGSGPRRPKTAPSAARSAPRAAQIRLPSDLGDRMGPTWRPNSPPELSCSNFWAPRGTIFPLPGYDFHITFNPPANRCKTALCAKLMQAYGQYRSTCLCHFYMWISTATDSRSRSTNPCICALTIF